MVSFALYKSEVSALLPYSNQIQELILPLITNLIINNNYQWKKSQV